MKVKKTIFFLCFPLTPKYWVLYHTLNGAILLVDEEVADIMLHNNKDPNELPSDIFNVLLEQGFLVPEELDEISFYQYVYNRSIFDNKNLGSVILTTYDCNFSCIYCYEKVNNIIRPAYMNIQIAEDVAKFLERKISELNCKFVSVCLYGGEPLLNLKAGIVILKHLSQFVDKKDIELQTSLITNGSLLDKEKLFKLIEFNLSNIQITLDGTREVHDKRRPFKDGKGSFDRIIKNILEIIDLLPPKTIVIRVNVDKMNYNNVPLLFEYLDTIGIKKKIKLSLGAPRGVFPYCLKMQYSDRELVQRITKLWIHAIKMGFDFHLEPYPILCSALLENSFIIDPYGDIYKCWSFVGMKKYSVGNIYERDVKPIFYKFVNRINEVLSKSPKCKTCNILPFCNGGCLYENFYAYGDPFVIACGNIFGRETLEAVVKLFTISRYKSLLEKEGISEQDIVWEYE